MDEEIILSKESLSDTTNNPIEAIDKAILRVVQGYPEDENLRRQLEAVQHQIDEAAERIRSRVPAGATETEVEEIIDGMFSRNDYLNLNTPLSFLPTGLGYRILEELGAIEQGKGYEGLLEIHNDRIKQAKANPNTSGMMVGVPDKETPRFFAALKTNVPGLVIDIQGEDWIRDKEDPDKVFGLTALRFTPALDRQGVKNLILAPTAA